MEKYTIKQFRSERGCLSYILNDNSSKEAILIDPSAEVNTDEYLKYIEDNKLILKYIIDTHTHADHISSAGEIKNIIGSQIIMHKNSPTHKKDIAIEKDTEIDLGDTKVKLIYTPGHTDESISIYVDGAVFTGDTLLIGGTGRTDFQAGDSEALYESIYEKLANLPDDTKVYPAHNYEGKTHSTIKDEKQTNPRMKMTKDEFIKTLNEHKPEKPELFDIAVEKNSQ